MSDRMPSKRRSSGGRHRSPAAPAHRRPRNLPGAVVKVGLAAALTVSLGGYTFAESATQEARIEGLQLHAQAEAQAHREAVAAERQRAVASAQDAMTVAAAVQSVAAPSVAEADLVPLTQAVDELNALLVEVPPLPAAIDPTTTDVAGDPGAAAGSAVTDAVPTDAAATEAATSDEADEAAAAPVVVDRDERASRAADRSSALPSETSADTAQAADPATEAPAPATDGVAGADEVAAGAAAAAAAPQPVDGGVADAVDAPAPADDAAPADDLAAEILAAVAKVTETAAQVQATADANLAAQEAAAAAAAAAAAEAEAQAAAAAATAAAAAAAEKEAQRTSLDAYANGQIPSSALCELPAEGGHQLRCDAADALTALDAAFAAEFGVPLTISDSYRSYEAQVACVRTKGYLCAKPGTSNHGLGLAVDLAGGIQTFGTKQHLWMAAHAATYGWDLPDWASAGGSKPEPWHWEYVD